MNISGHKEKHYLTAAMVSTERETLEQRVLDAGPSGSGSLWEAALLPVRPVYVAFDPQYRAVS